MISRRNGPGAPDLIPRGSHPANINDLRDVPVLELVTLHVLTPLTIGV